VRRALAIVILLVILLSAGAPVRAASDEWSLSGSVGAEVRIFPDDPLFVDQFDGAQASAILAPELRWRSEDRSHQFKITPFGRLDGRDDERTHFDLREAYYRYVGPQWELLAGINQIFWGVTEARHLVDVINQKDAVDDIDEEDKLGQPMINVAFQQDWGRLDFYALLGFRERTFPGRDGRLRPPFPIDGDAAHFESGAGNDRLDLALRWSHFVEDWDIGVHLFHGTGREPILLADPARQRFIPFYEVTNQAGLDLQYTKEAWLWKLEALVREGQGDTFGAGVAGFEYTLYQVGGSAADIGLLAEYLYDGRDDDAPLTIFDNDTFIGTRLAFNDVQDSQILLGAVIDNSDQSVAAFLEAERRMGQNVTLELEGRFFLDVNPAGDLRFLANDSFVTLRASWNL
jgi:hypothetical protein